MKRGPKPKPAQEVRSESLGMVRVSPSELIRIRKNHQAAQAAEFVEFSEWVRKKLLNQVEIFRCAPKNNTNAAKKNQK